MVRAGRGLNRRGGRHRDVKLAAMAAWPAHARADRRGHEMCASGMPPDGSGATFFTLWLASRKATI